MLLLLETRGFKLGESQNFEDDIVWDDQLYQKVCDGLTAKSQNNQKLAESLLQEAFKEGSTEALAELGVLYVEQGETTLANRAIKLAIKAGELASLQKLAGLRWKGSDKICELVFEKGQEQLNAKASNYRHWYKLAARLGHAKSAALLSLVDGNSVDEQKEWLYILIEADDTTAMVELAEILISESSFQEAENLLLKAKSLGSTFVEDSLLTLDEVMNNKVEYEKVCALFEEGFDAKNEGDLLRAESCWREVILFTGNDRFDRVLEALDCLGVLLANQGRLLEAVDFWCDAYKRSIAEWNVQRYSERLEYALAQSTDEDEDEIEKKIAAVGLHF